MLKNNNINLINQLPQKVNEWKTQVKKEVIEDMKLYFKNVFSGDIFTEYSKIFDYNIETLYRLIIIENNFDINTYIEKNIKYANIATFHGFIYESIINKQQEQDYLIENGIMIDDNKDIDDYYEDSIKSLPQKVHEWKEISKDQAIEEMKTYFKEVFAGDIFVIDSNLFNYTIKRFYKLAVVEDKLNIDNFVKMKLKEFDEEITLYDCMQSSVIDKKNERRCANE